jgi:hypothetical protein
MSVFCWHQVALVGVSEAARRLGTLPGLGDAPVDGGWVAARLAWFPVLALVLAGIVGLVRRFENPVPAAPVAPPRLVLGSRNQDF